MAQDISIVIDRIREIASRTLGQLENQARTTERSFTDLDLSPGAFGDWPQSHDLARHHDGAHDVFRSTIEGVVADLQSFGEKLMETANTSEAQDEAIEEHLRQLDKNYREGGLHSRNSYRDMVQAQTGRSGVDAEDLLRPSGATTSATGSSVTMPADGAGGADGTDELGPLPAVGPA